MKNDALSSRTLFRTLGLALFMLALTGLDGCKSDSATSAPSASAASTPSSSAVSTPASSNANGNAAATGTASKPPMSAEDSRYLGRYHRDSEGKSTR